MKHYVTRNAVNPENIARKIDLVQLEVNQNRGIQTAWQSRYKNLAEELESISLYSGLGWDVTLDFESKKYIFDVNQGRDLTVNQSVNPPVIFSPEFESVITQHFADSDLNYKNVGYIAGQGEGAEREIIVLGGANGLDRHETFVDARDVEDSALLETRGQQRMKEFDIEQYFEAQIITPVTTKDNTNNSHHANINQAKEKLYSTFIYEKDYALGDLVTVQNRSWGVTMDTRITEMTEIYEPNNTRIEATFGNSRPTLISVIKKKFAEMENEVKR